jgi:hypothetical protein
MERLGPKLRPEKAADVAAKIGAGLLKEAMRPGAGAFWGGWLVGEIACSKLRLKMLPSLFLPTLCGYAAYKGWQLAEDVHKLATMAQAESAFTEDLVTPEAELHAPRKV